jgi:mRNA-degrading endonuclease YafQ of YafQ-DinJ toxin-antitoxin module
MINIVWDQGFKRVYRKKILHNDELKGRFWDAVKKFTSNPFDQKLKTHKLTGKLQGLWAFSVDYNCRVIFRFMVRMKFCL